MENLLGYANDDVLVPFELNDDPWVEGLSGLNVRATAWCEEVNAAMRSEVCAVLADGLAAERVLLGELPSSAAGSRLQADQREG